MIDLKSGFLAAGSPFERQASDDDAAESSSPRQDPARAGPRVAGFREELPPNATGKVMKDQPR
ncbi:hypothetical protein [Streptomyces sp. NPDC054804]